MRMFQATVNFYATDTKELYGTETVPVVAEDEQEAVKNALRDTEESKFSDPRINHYRGVILDDIEIADDEFICENCHAVCDIENSIKIGGKKGLLYCDKCADEYGHVIMEEAEGKTGGEG